MVYWCVLRDMWTHMASIPRSLPISCYYSTPLDSPSPSQMDHGGGCREMVPKEAAADVARWYRRRRRRMRRRQLPSTNQKTQICMLLSSSSANKFDTVHSPIKKRKSQYELSDPRLSSLKHKFRGRLIWQEDESARTESLGCDGVFIDKNCDMGMANIVEELHSCENTQSLLGGCIEVDSINGVESQSMRKVFQVWASTSSSSSNNISSEAFSSSHGIGTKETDSWVMQHLEHDHPGLMLQPYDGDIERIYDVLGQYNVLMKNELATGDVDGSVAHIMDEKLYSNGVDDFLILPTGQTGCHGEKKLTIDQEFEQYFSRLML